MTIALEPWPPLTRVGVWNLWMDLGKRTNPHLWLAFEPRVLLVYGVRVSAAETKARCECIS